jgi:TetR/AcrR family transcriptional regulator, ethionamide resistance regulator
VSDPVRSGEGVPRSKRAAIQASVLRATEELLQEGASYADLNIERIANRAGISRTAFYFYFRDKRELLERLTEEVSETLYAQAQIWWKGGGDPVVEIREALTQIVTTWHEHGVLLRAIVEVSTYDEEVGAFWRGIVGRFIDASEERIEHEQAAGRALAGPAHALAFALVWMTERTIYQQVSQGRPLSESELVDALCALWTRVVYGG